MSTAAQDEARMLAAQESNADAEAAVAAMACKVLGIETLATRNSDSLDFHEVAVWQIEDLISRAYEMGRAAARA